MHTYFDLTSVFEADLKRCIPIIFACCLIVIVAAFIDMWTAIDASKACKEPIESAKLRKTVSKILDYLRLIFYFSLIDLCGFFFQGYSLPFAVIFATLGVLLLEGKSIIKENFVKKKSAASEVPDIIQKIIECSTKKDADELIKFIKKIK